ncbi:hypothetical protein FQN60_018537 [Etheostoma spectabile]|uniref:Beta/gamma crystallin 'Greek key' domain-containing protein n=1 Tax=Etheostoma spectabile TaxID=54343 RepID=A0A5J5DIB2_9PERO|nr:hypothetical protein FQN60_018537 [Etheostoma spectabile]
MLATMKGLNQVGRQFRSNSTSTANMTNMNMRGKHRGQFRIKIYERENFGGQSYELIDDCDNMMDRYRMNDCQSCHPRVVPYALKSQVEEELEHLQALEIVDPVQFSRWAERAVHKPNQKWLPGGVQTPRGSLSFFVKLTDGQEFCRHQDHIHLHHDTGLEIVRTSVSPGEPDYCESITRGTVTGRRVCAP